MWSCTMALNGLIQKESFSDWVLHGIGHELTAQFGIDHARTFSHYCTFLITVIILKLKKKISTICRKSLDKLKVLIEEKALKGIENGTKV